ncbi:protein phosphatase 2C domain-containing protein [Kitasatospora sp. NPDC004615]|uniref:protein phosphatase 2C domain-containing protein n=1 Tax=Kitasatospora sp. NPDC004615 TaxID=3364017 RepID=UPI0036BB23D6
MVDRAGAVFEPRPPKGRSYRADTESDGWSTPRAQLRMASVRGNAHRYYGKPRQDSAAAAVHAASGTIVFAVADGVSAAEVPELGSALACESALGAVLDRLDAGQRPVEWAAVLRDAAAALLERGAALLDDPAPDPAKVERLLATTLVVGTACPVPGGLDVALSRVGDSGAWALDLHHAAYRALFAPKSAPDAEVVSNAVVPLPRCPEPAELAGCQLTAGQVLLVGTDGFGDPLGDGTGLVGALFARQLATEPSAAWLAHVLDFSRETFDDDRTLIALWPVAEPGPLP